MATHGKVYDQNFLNQFFQYTAILEKEADRIELPVTKDAAHSLVELLKRQHTSEERNVAVAHAYKSLFSELRARTFLQLEPSKVPLAFEPHQFGEEVDVAFHHAAWDIEEASRCLAFDRATACVFHLMKVLEFGLYTLATDLNIVKLEENWANAIEQIEKAIKEFGRNRPDKNATDTEREQWKAKVQFYSDCATHFRYVKDAWRNQTTHTRQGNMPYSEEKAGQVYDNVRGFMQTLATRLHEQP